MKIRAYQPSDEAAVIGLWEACGLIRPWNDPRKDIARKLAEQPELFLAGTFEGEVVATAMAGYDGPSRLGHLLRCLTSTETVLARAHADAREVVERRLIERG